MMKRTNISILVLVLSAFLVKAQDKGIHFEQNMSWQQVQAKARAEHKYIFMDCYATWCVPCKYMSQKVFTLPEVGDLVNEKFISVGIQMDSTAKDDTFTKSVYSDAKTIMKIYRVGSFPTYLFFDENGHIVHRAGGSMPVESFIQVAKEATDKTKQYYTLLEQYQKGSRDSAMLRQLTLSSVSIDDPGLTTKFTGDYIGSMKNVYSRDNLEFIGHLTKSSKEKGFDLWLHHAKQVNAVMGSNDYANRKVINVILNEEPDIIALNKPGTPVPDWNKIHQNIKTQYNNYYADRTTKWIKISFYNQRKQWSAYTASLVDYNKTYVATMSPFQLNSFAWDVFTHSNKKTELLAALKWSKSTLNSSDSFLYTYYDTYASLLFKLNRKGEAIDQEEIALAKAPEKEKPGMQQTLDKMKQGIKTWD